MKPETEAKIAEIRARIADGTPYVLHSLSRDQDYYGFTRDWEGVEVSALDWAITEAHAEWAAAQKAKRYEDADAFRSL
jgi:hypothetical protein